MRARSMVLPLTALALAAAIGRFVPDSISGAGAARPRSEPARPACASDPAASDPAASDPAASDSVRPGRSQVSTQVPVQVPVIGAGEELLGPRRAPPPAPEPEPPAEPRGLEDGEEPLPLAPPGDARQAGEVRHAPANEGDR